MATLHDVFKGLDVAAFEAALSRWIARAQGRQRARAQAVASDDKTLRGSQGHRLPGVHLLAALEHAPWRGRGAGTRRPGTRRRVGRRRPTAGPA